MNNKPSVFLDLDNTILDFSKAEHFSLSGTLRDLGIEPTDEMIQLYSKINLLQWEKLERGEIDREEILTRRFVPFFEAIGIEGDSCKAELLYEEYLCRSTFMVDGAKQLLEAIYNDYDLYVASNGIGFVQERRLNGARIKKYFKEVFVSEELGFNKPDKRFFQRCFEAAPQISPQRCVIVGDSLTSDILGGINAGIPTVWFNPGRSAGREDIVPDYEINALSMLPELLRNIFA